MDRNRDQSILTVESWVSQVGRKCSRYACPGILRLQRYCQGRRNPGWDSAYIYHLGRTFSTVEATRRHGSPYLSHKSRNPIHGLAFGKSKRFPMTGRDTGPGGKNRSLVRALQSKWKRNQAINERPSTSSNIFETKNADWKEVWGTGERLNIFIYYRTVAIGAFSCYPEPRQRRRLRARKMAAGSWSRVFLVYQAQLFLQGPAGKHTTSVE